MAAPSRVVCPTEAVMESLMETLVDPLLLSRSSNVPPSDDTQKSVANQMHAVVLLYNYYHRKQKPELPFLDFVRFCKLAVSVRPSLTEFMNLVKENESVRLDVDDDQLSVTEKSIKNACNIAQSLDASRNVPNIKGWPISKVAVLLVDSKKENCFLQFGPATLGVWSPIEKELTDACISPEGSSEKKAGNKRKRNDLKTWFLQLACNAVRDITGIVSSDLQILETSVTYSLSKENSAVCFYMMQCSGSFSVNNQVPLKFLVESLQGPLVENLSIGFWKSTAVVEYHHMLPYMDFIFSCISGSISCPSRDLSQYIANCDNSMEEMCVIDDAATKSESRINLEVPYPSCDDQMEVLPLDPSRKLSRVGTVEDYLVERSSENPDILGSIGKEKSKISVDILDEDSIGKSLQPINISDFTETCPNRNDGKKAVNSSCRVYLKRKNSTSSQNDAYVQEDDIQMQVDTVCSSEPNEKCTGEKRSVCIVDANVPCNQNIPAATEYQLSCNADVGGTKCNIVEPNEKCTDENRSVGNVDVNVPCNQNVLATTEYQLVSCDANTKPNCSMDVDGTKCDIVEPNEKCTDEMRSVGNVDVNVPCNQNILAATEYQLDCSMDVDGTKCDIVEPNEKCTDEMRSIGNVDVNVPYNQNVLAATEYQLACSDANAKSNCSADVDGTKCNIVEPNEKCIDEKGSVGNVDDANVPGNQNVLVAREYQLVCRDANTKPNCTANVDGTKCNIVVEETKCDANVEANCVPASEELQNALVLLYRKRQEQYSQICAHGDTLALYEDYIERIRDGGDVGLGRHCTEMIISGNSHFLLEQRNQVRDCEDNDQKGKKSSEIYFPGKSSCEDLEYMCLKNNWRLPTYSIEPSNGKFASNVVVRGKDFKLSLQGEFECNPCVARESAAALMIAQLRSSHG